MAATALRPRSATEIVDATFQLLRAHYLQLVTIVAVLYAPQIVLTLMLPESLVILPRLLALVMNSLATGATILIVSDAYLGRRVDPAAALRTTGSRVGTLILAALLQGALVTIGFVLLIVPGFIALAFVVSMVPAVMVERLGAGAAFARSRELARGHVGHILKALLLLGLIYVGGMAVTYALLGAFTGASGFLDERNLNVAGDLLGVFIAPILAVGITMVYYDLRIRKDGFDLEMMAQDLDATPNATRPRMSASASA